MQCVDCGAEAVQRKGPVGPIPKRCTTCRVKRKTAQIRDSEKKRIWTPEAKEQARALARARTARWRAQNIEIVRERDRAKKRQIAADPALRARASQMHRAANLKKFYGITVERYDEMLASQGGVCAICKGLPRSGRRLHIDHDHACCAGKKSCGRCVRGLLCDFCNHGLGRFSDDPELLETAIRYLRRAVRQSG